MQLISKSFSNSRCIIIRNMTTIQHSAMYEKWLICMHINHMNDI